MREVKRVEWEIFFIRLVQLYFHVTVSSFIMICSSAHISGNLVIAGMLNICIYIIPTSIIKEKIKGNQYG